MATNEQQPANFVKPSEEKVWMKYWGEDLPYAQDLDMPAFAYIMKKNKKFMNDIALSYYDREITYAELKENVEKTAKAFNKLGVKEGDIVTVCSVMIPETIYAFYAADMLGITLNMVDPRTSPNGLREYIEEVHSKVVIFINVVYDKIKEAVQGTEVETVIASSPADSLPKFLKFAYNLKNKAPKYEANVLTWQQFIANAENEEAATPVEYDPKRALLIMHTGGTTGRPKGVLLSPANMNALAVQYCFRRAVNRQESFLDVMPPFIAYGFGCGVHAPLSVGVKVILIPQFDPNKLGALLNKYHPNHMAGVPLHYRNLLKDPKVKNADLSYLVSTGAGGDGITAADEDQVNDFLIKHNSPYKLTKGYGMTEVNAAATACVRDIHKRGSVGISMFLTTTAIFEPGTDKELDYDCEGEICFKTPTMMLGYYNMPEETAKVIKKHSDGEYWVHSGDIGKIDRDGFIFVLNRLKRVIIRHDGFKIFPLPIEEKVVSVPGVSEACAVAIRDGNHEQGNLPYVFVKAIDSACDKAALEAKIRKACSDDLAEYIQPVAYEFVDELPYTNIGKVDYMTLQKRLIGKEVKR